MPNKKKQKALFKILRDHFGRNLPFALYKKPGAQMMTAVLQSDKALNTTLDFDRPGFVMAPFDGEDAPLVFLRPDALYHCKFKPLKHPFRLADPIPNPVGREIHLDLVEQAKKSIVAEAFQKVVVSRRFSVPVSADLLSTAFGMMQVYPNAFTYFFHHPSAGTWLGATPELLLKSHAGFGETMALAGTRSADPTLKEHEWTSKELYEQQVVTDFIEKQMQAMQLEAQVGPVENIRAGKLWHLGTVIRTPLPITQAGALLRALHPTPAVCGVPRDKAQFFIREHENYNREYYTGFLGEIGIEQPESFSTYVNLRCIQIRNGRAYVYVGGGITADSKAEAEWEETQHKSTTVLSLLENSWKAIG
ncbi:MAG: chorismate-binding protein [Robiginitalea sp.]|uniref:chorismate-binding protein n=1 Tax=Robiginitalea sp. TaxID=1902411 RepID=UPI003C7920A4